MELTTEAKLTSTRITVSEQLGITTPVSTEAPLVSTRTTAVAAATTTALTASIGAGATSSGTPPLTASSFSVYWGLNGGESGDTSVLGSIITSTPILNVTAFHPSLGPILTDVYHAPCASGNVLNAVEWLGVALELFGVETNSALQALVERHCRAIHPKIWVVPRTGRGEDLVGIQLLPLF